MHWRRWSALSAAAISTIQSAQALTLDIADPASIKQSASSVAQGLINFYTGGVPGQIASNIPGLLPGPYYWWEAGGMIGSLIDYVYYTGDDSYNHLVAQALQFQVGPDENYMPPNQSQALGNDDQCFWAMAAMSAAETKFPNPSPDLPQWLALAQAVFNSQAQRWDPATCRGGLRWQIFSFNNGYDYKNAITNGCFFNLASRLGAYTHNQTYFDWADKAWDWTQGVQFISSDYMVFDGSSDLVNCTDISPMQWTYNAGVFLLGAAVMWNQTTGRTQSLWEMRVLRLLDAAHIFFQSDVMFEAACEPRGTCNTDQLSFKAYLSRWLAATAKVAPFTYDDVMALLQSSASAAAASCTDGTDAVLCGSEWTSKSYNGYTGVGQQMCALEVIQCTLLDSVAGPVSRTTGGTSKGNAAAGGGDDDLEPVVITTASDRAGAGIVTGLLLLFIIGGSWWLVC